MKKLSHSVVVALTASLLLSSCSRMASLSVTKRHYRSGYYVDLGSNKQDASKQQRAVASMPVIAPTSVDAENRNAMLLVNEIPVQAPVIANLTEKPGRAHSQNHSKVYASTLGKDAIAKDMQDANLKSHTSSMPDVNAAASSSSGGSTPQWLIILFAILIPPLGVGLKFGIVDKFWISLLLTIIFWLPGAIYSVIVVTQK